MRIQSPPPQTPQRPASKNDKPPADDGPRYEAASRDWHRDTLLTSSGVGSCLLPGFVGKATGVSFGALAGITGLGELHEGVRRGNVHEAFDGALHIVAGGGLIATGLSHGTALAPFLAAGTATLLLAKGVYDSPAPLARFVANESKNLAVDSGRVIAQGAVAAWHSVFPPKNGGDPPPPPADPKPPAEDSKPKAP